MAQSVPPLPAGLSFSYLAEGGANVVFRMHQRAQHPASTSPSRRADTSSASTTTTPPPTTPPPTEPADRQEVDPSQPSPRWQLAGRAVLLRLRKDVAGATCVGSAHRDYAAIIAPLFTAENLVGQWPVGLGPGTVDRLNDLLTKLERSGGRPAKRRGGRLAQARVGLLVLDMSARPGRDVCAVEVKPKWLVQSPTAPRGADRCRTCALRACRGARDGGLDLARGFCPLALLSRRPDQTRAVVTDVLAANEVHAEGETMDRVSTVLSENQLLQLLRKLQIKYNTDSLLMSSTADLDLRVAMTIRDCAMFIRIPVSPDEKVEVRLGDLDLKSPSKLTQWKASETKLIDEGWYSETARPPSSMERRCVLSTRD